MKKGKIIVAIACTLLVGGIITVKAMAKRTTVTVWYKTSSGGSCLPANQTGITCDPDATDNPPCASGVFKYYTASNCALGTESSDQTLFQP